MEKIRRICFVSFHAYPLFDPKKQGYVGGAEVQLYQLSLELAKHPDNDIRFIVGDYGQHPIEEVDDVKIYKFIDKLPFYLNIKKLRVLLMSYKLLQILKKINADIYVQRAAGCQTGIVAFFCKRYKKKFVYMTAHEGDCNPELLSWVKPLEKRVYLYGLKHANLVITQSNHHADLLSKTCKVDTKVLKNSFRINAQTGIKKEYILWVSRCDNWKHPELFLQLAQMFLHESFVMVCPMAASKDAYFKHIKAQAAQIKNMEFIDYVPFQNINDYFKRSKIFVNTSEHEGFPNTFIQAWMNKTPVVSLSVDPDHIISSNALGFCSGSLDNMEHHIRLLLTDNRSYHRIAENCYRYVKEQHDIHKNVIKFADYLNGLA